MLCILHNNIQILLIFYIKKSWIINHTGCIVSSIRIGQYFIQSKIKLKSFNGDFFMCLSVFICCVYVMPSKSIVSLPYNVFNPINKFGYSCINTVASAASHSKACYTDQMVCACWIRCCNLQWAAYHNNKWHTLIDWLNKSCKWSG